MDIDDDLAPLRSFLADPSPVDAAVRARARARLVGAIAVARPRAADRGLGRGRALPEHARRRTFPASGVAAAAVAAGILFAIVLPAVSPSLAPDASAALSRLATVVGGGWEGPAPTEFIYTRSSGDRAACDRDSCTLDPFERESWVALDGSGRVLETVDGRIADQRFDVGELSFEDGRRWLGLSEAGLREELAALTGETGAGGFAAFAAIGRLMGETELLPEVRSALFELAATFAHTIDLGTATDALGRSGIGVGYESEDLRYEILFDRNTALVLEERVIGLRDRAKPIRIGAADPFWLAPGTRITYRSSGVVASLNARPGG